MSQDAGIEGSAGFAGSAGLAGAAGSSASAGKAGAAGSGGQAGADAGGSAGSVGDGAVETDAPTEGGDGAQPDCSVEGVPGECMDVAACEALADHAATPGFCPGPSNIQCCVPYGLALCDPAVVQLPNASKTAEAAGQGGCPAGMVRVTTFCIDQFEASLVWMSDGTSWSPYLFPDVPVRAVSVKGAVPQGYINQVKADEACSNAGKRLCTDDEWLRACQGPTDTTYPYGDALQLGVCNDHRDVHPAVEYFGTTDSWIYSEIDNACLNQLPMSLQPAGSLAGCVTAEGAYDMMGNLHEWTADPAGTFRGGFYVDTVLNGPGCLYATTAHNTLHWDYSTGFRCCAD
ncbi:MAG: SUMF1/EgtB/PvdO family nonheme iron enzyme [Deltaproteobacteria bacterium]|nr:SUMF1/EgtB/PvdO family nonheme iron enzyme [Deltaproteobacteria bacterium]